MPNIMGVATSARTINVTWTHPDPTTVESFDVGFTFSILGCPGDNGYNNVVLQRSTLTPIKGVYRHDFTNTQEDSEYVITVAAINSVGLRAADSQTVLTSVAGKNPAPPPPPPPHFLVPSHSPLPPLPTCSPLPVPLFSSIMWYNNYKATIQS